MQESCQILRRSAMRAKFGMHNSYHPDLRSTKLYYNALGSERIV